MMRIMPSREIVATALQVEVQALALSMGYPADESRIFYWSGVLSLGMPMPRSDE